MENGILEVILMLEIVFMHNSESKRIFGDGFVKNNKEKCKLIYNGDEKELKEYYQEFDNKDFIKFKLKFNNNTINMSHMFDRCKNIISIKFEENTNEIDIGSNNNSINNSQVNFTLENNPNSLSSSQNKELFYNNETELCKGIVSSIFSTAKANNSNNVSSESNLLIKNSSISFISKIIVTNMREMFSGCNSLKSLPDISKWNTSNVKYMNSMFSGCNSLISLPDISKWNISNVNEMNSMFYGCKALSLLPDISKWNTSNVNEMSGMFDGCINSLEIPSKFKK